MKRYELQPTNGSKSFYGKAYIEVDEAGNETLYSYNTPIIRKDTDNSLHRLYPDYTATTGKHIIAFCGLNKAAFMKMEVE